MFTPNRLNADLHALGLRPSRDLFSELADAYSAADRHYHNKKHIAECLAALDRNVDLAERPPEVAIALWFHDAIYDARRNDNEEQSAKWASSFLKNEGLDSQSATRIYALIMATRHCATVEDPDQQLLVDIDLGILGQSATAFEVYDAAIRREYSWVPDTEYRVGRVAVLRDFLNRDKIYSTERFFKLYESQARTNLINAISGLGQIP